jgi:hypothetical protein
MSHPRGFSPADHHEPALPTPTPSLISPFRFPLSSKQRPGGEGVRAASRPAAVLCVRLGHPGAESLMQITQHQRPSNPGSLSFLNLVGRHVVCPSGAGRGGPACLRLARPSAVLEIVRSVLSCGSRPAHASVARCASQVPVGKYEPIAASGCGAREFCLYPFSLLVVTAGLSISLPLFIVGLQFLSAACGS